MYIIEPVAFSVLMEINLKLASHHIYHRITSFHQEVWAHNIYLIPPLLIVSVQRQ